MTIGLRLASSRVKRGIAIFCIRLLWVLFRLGTDGVSDNVNFLESSLMKVYVAFRFLKRAYRVVVYLVAINVVMRGGEKLNLRRFEYGEPAVE